MGEEMTFSGNETERIVISYAGSVVVKVARQSLKLSGSSHRAPSRRLLNP